VSLLNERRITLYKSDQYNIYTRIVVLSGPGSVHFVPVVLVMYPEFGPVWHGQSSICAGPYSRVPGIRSEGVSTG